MTREEAIKELEILKEEYWDDDGYGHETKQYDDTMTALDMAIKALEQEPRKEEVILTKEEYGELVSSEFDNGYAKGYREALEEQEPILDKIRAEIEQTTSRYTISRERGAMGQVEWSDRLIKESEVLEIIDKYKTESEE